MVLFYVWLISPNLAKERVALRVKKGGHKIPEPVIETRYYKSLKNFTKYAKAVDEWYIYNNTKDYELIAECVAGKQNIFNSELYNKIVEK